MFDWVYDLVAASAITYLVIVGFVWVDGFFPVVPGETVVITGGVLAAQGDLVIWLVIAAGWAGALLGDNTSYLLGDKVGGWAAGKLFRTERAQERLDRGLRQVDRRAWIILVARFIPGGRTAVTFASGMLDEFPWRRFIRWDVPGGFLWAVYASMLGFIGGETFQRSLWLPLVVSLAVAGILTLAAEVLRRALERRDRAAAS